MFATSTRVGETKRLTVIVREGVMLLRSHLDVILVVDDAVADWFREVLPS